MGNKKLFVKVIFKSAVAVLFTVALIRIIFMWDVSKVKGGEPNGWEQGIFDKENCWTV